MLQCLQGNAAVADDGDNVPFFGGPSTPLASTAPSGKGTERHQADVVRTVAPDGTLTCMLATTPSSLFAEVWSVPHARRSFASGAIHVWCAMHAFAQARVFVGTWW